MVCECTWDFRLLFDGTICTEIFAVLGVVREEILICWGDFVRNFIGFASEYKIGNGSNDAWHNLQCVNSIYLLRSDFALFALKEIL